MKRTRSGTVMPIDPNRSRRRSRKVCLVLREAIHDRHSIYCLDSPGDDQSESRSETDLPEPVMVLDSIYPIQMGMAATQSALYFMGGVFFKNGEDLVNDDMEGIKPKAKDWYEGGEVVPVCQKSVYKVPFSKLTSSSIPPGSSSPSSLMVKVCDLISTKRFTLCVAIPGTTQICVADLSFDGLSNFELFDEETGSCSKLPDPVFDSVGLMMGYYISESGKLYIHIKGGNFFVLDFMRSSSEYNWVSFKIPCLRFWETSIGFGLILKEGVGDSHILFPGSNMSVAVRFPSSLEDLSSKPFGIVLQVRDLYEVGLDVFFTRNLILTRCLLASGNNNPILYRVRCGFTDESRFADEMLSDIAID